ncbi:MAG: hypothetical protein HY332_22085 [Chloroflexi bacterium]|nr:hypothetical protein [Chloroflexota bacterium]
MKTMTWGEAQRHTLAEAAEDVLHGGGEPVLVEDERGGTAVLLVPVPEDWPDREVEALSHSERFWQLIDRSRRRGDDDAVPAEQVWAELGLEPERNAAEA